MNEYAVSVSQIGETNYPYLFAGQHLDEIGQKLYQTS